MKQKFDFIQFEWGYVEAQTTDEAFSKITDGNSIFVNSSLMVAPAKVNGIFPPYSPQEVLQLLAELKIAIVWSVADFETKASEIEYFAGKTLFDRALFQEALERMISKHDAAIGISWTTVQEYLQNQCLLKM